MSGTASKSERRKEQNRRAQANLRKRQREKVEPLEQQLEWLRTQAQSQETAGGEIPVQIITHPPLLPMSSQAYHDFCTISVDDYQRKSLLTPAVDGSYEDFQYIPTDPPSYMLDETMLPEPTSTIIPDVLAPYNHHLVTPAQLSSITPTPPIISSTREQITNETQFQAITTNRQHHCAFAALSENAVLLKISPESFLLTHSSSPFYSPLRSVDSIAASITHLPTEFHPTMAQLSYPHQPWIDCVPLRDLRSRIIFAVSHRPPFLDSLDLWHDVLSDGLSCGADPRNPALWIMSDDFMARWQMLLTLDLEALKQMCLNSNPPVRFMSLSEPLHIVP